MVVLFDARLSIRLLFESGVHWRFGVYYNSGLEPRNFITDITGFMLMLSCYSHTTVWAGTKILAPNKITYRRTAVIDVLQNATYLEKQQHMWSWRHS